MKVETPLGPPPPFTPLRPPSPVHSLQGKHEHKWELLRRTLAENMCYGDAEKRYWLAADGSGGLVYTADQVGWLPG